MRIGRLLLDAFWRKLVILHPINRFRSLCLRDALGRLLIDCFEKQIKRTGQDQANWLDLKSEAAAIREAAGLGGAMCNYLACRRARIS